METCISFTPTSWTSHTSCSCSTTSSIITESDDYFFSSIINQIKADPNISQEEKSLLVKFYNLYDSESDDIEIFNEVDQIIDQLIAGAGEGHLYAYFYHSLKAMDWMERFFDMTPEQAGYPLDKCLDLAIRSLDESIRLNPQFKDGYFLRGVMRMEKANFDSSYYHLAREDLIQALGLSGAKQFFDSRRIPWRN